MSVTQVVRWSRSHAHPERYAAKLHALMHWPTFGNDGLTDDERNLHAARYAATVGKTPTSTPDRTERLALLAGKVDARAHRRPSTV